MTALRKLVRAQITALGDDEVEVVMSTAALARDGHILVPQGCILENYRANPITLWSHDPDKPVGNAENIDVGAAQIAARVRFAPLGISRKADEIRGLTKAGVIRAVSVGFEPIEMEPLDPKKPRGGQRITQWELLELSFVSVPADSGAVVTARQHSGTNGDTDMTDAAGAEGAETPADDLAVTAVRTPRAPKKRAVRVGRAAIATRERGVPLVRGLYQVAELCAVFQELDYHVDWAKWEAAYEEDGSQVPAMLAAVLGDLGEALLAMTKEEIAEALAGHDDLELEDCGADTVLLVEERAHIAAATTPRMRAFRRAVAMAKVRAGKTLSGETVKALRSAKALHEDAMALHRGAIAKHKDAMTAVDDLMDRAGVSDADDDTTEEVQTSDGTAKSGGSENGRANADFESRQADLAALNKVA